MDSPATSQRPAGIVEIHGPRDYATTALAVKAVNPNAVMPQDWPSLQVWHRAVPQDLHYPRARYTLATEARV